MLSTAELMDITFSPTRLREGYEVAEVDAFLADVKQSIASHESEVTDLRDELAEARQAAEDNQAAGAWSGANTGPNAREGSYAAARLLEIATTNAEQLVTEATAEAAALVQNARAEADRATADLADDKQRHEAELDQHRTQVLTEVADRQRAVEAKIAMLERLERDHRSHMRAYLSEQLDQLGEDEAPTLQAVGD
ncbi:MAG: DivIVA domain-containing protein [Nocardioidaceae bacterium]